VDLPESWTAIVNPAAGRGRARFQLPRTADALARADLDVEIHLSADADDLRRLAIAAFDAGRGVIACGGDGTVSTVAGLAAEHDGVLGLVPSGSGNDFARQLGIPRDDVEAAVAALVDAQVVPVDLGRAHAADGTTTWFATVANVGFDAEANRWSNGVRWTSGAPLYVLATLRTLMHYRPRPFRITVDDETFDTDAWLVAIGNTRTYASGMMITPDADLHDGALDVCVVGPVSRLDFLRTFPSVFRGGHVEHPIVETYRGATVTVESPDVATPELWAGGEHAGTLPARMEAVPSALRVAVPRLPPRRVPI